MNLTGSHPRAFGVLCTGDVNAFKPHWFNQHSPAKLQAEKVSDSTWFLECFWAALRALRQLLTLSSVLQMGRRRGREGQGKDQGRSACLQPSTLCARAERGPPGFCSPAPKG